jgi:Carboxypeptidase regulatory-like domain
MLLVVRRAVFSRKMARLCAIVGAVSSCAYDEPLAPVIPHEVPTAQFAPLAFVTDINLTSGRISITPPAAVTIGAPTLSVDGRSTQPTLSLLGAEAIRLIPSNYHASEVGQYAPNKVRVTFDITIENRLPRVALTTPTWPQAPAPGVILFPLDYVTTTTPGGVNGADGNALIVEVPSAGAVVPSADWNGTGAAGSGSPYGFFNDIGCTAATSDECFRWMAFDLAVQPNSNSSTRTVGFDIDASVAQFRTRMIVAADLVPAAIVSPVRVSGRVTSLTGGAISGARITALTGEHATTDTSGVYNLSGLESGAVMLTVSKLPAGCEIPPTRLLSIAAGDSAVVDFSVTCSAPTGMITGTLTYSVGGAPIAGATVVSSTGGSAVTSAAGSFVMNGAGSGSGTVTVSVLPAGCSVTALPFVLQLGGAVTLDLVANCLATPTPPNQ